MPAKRPPVKKSAQSSWGSFRFKDWLISHARWKLELVDLIAGKSARSWDVDQVKHDGKCQLGQWIYRYGPLFHEDIEFQQLRRDHAAFHEAAAAVVRAVFEGDRKRAQSMLGEFGEFMEASRKVVNLITFLERRYNSPGQDGGK